MPDDDDVGIGLGTRARDSFLFFFSFLPDSFFSSSDFLVTPLRVHTTRGILRWLFKNAFIINT